MAKVKFLKSHPAYSYFAGDSGEITDEAASKLLSQGFIIIVPEPEKRESKKVVNPLPEDLPGRDKLFEVGFDSILKIKEAGDSLLDAGISNTTFKKIVSYLKKYVFE
jgi:hypothetical protein